MPSVKFGACHSAARGKPLAFRPVRLYLLHCLRDKVTAATCLLQDSLPAVIVR